MFSHLHIGHISQVNILILLKLIIGGTVQEISREIDKRVERWVKREFLLLKIELSNDALVEMFTNQPFIRSNVDKYVTFVKCDRSF
jgi:hypothetical protein